MGVHNNYDPTFTKDIKEIKNLLKVVLILVGQEHGLTKEELESLVNKPIGDISVG